MIFDAVRNTYFLFGLWDYPEKAYRLGEDIPVYTGILFLDIEFSDDMYFNIEFMEDIEFEIVFADYNFNIEFMDDIEFEIELMEDIEFNIEFAENWSDL